MSQTMFRTIGKNSKMANQVEKKKKINPLRSAYEASIHAKNTNGKL